jgi:hypothetical protein
MIYLLRFKDIVSNHERRQGKFPPIILGVQIRFPKNQRRAARALQLLLIIARRPNFSSKKIPRAQGIFAAGPEVFWGQCGRIFVLVLVLVLGIELE